MALGVRMSTLCIRGVSVRRPFTALRARMVGLLHRGYEDLTGARERRRRGTCISCCRAELVRFWVLWSKRKDELVTLALS
jgi:hypothetical protein